MRRGARALGLAAVVWAAHLTGPSAAGEKAQIALVIDDLGWDLMSTVEIAALPGPLTFAFLPYPEGLAEQVAIARRAGHAIIVHVPMEPLGRMADAGAMALGAAMAPEQIARRLDWALARVPGAVGINNHMGSRFTADCAAMAALFEAFARRKLAYIDSRTTGRSIARPAAARAGIAFAARDVFIDHDRDRAAIARSLTRLEEIAFLHGQAIGIGHPDPATIATLQAWLPDVPSRGFTLVPATRLARVPPRAAAPAACTGERVVSAR